MLQKLSISNYALIDDLEIVFDKGLNIMTGETGAGKSIVLGALSLILGQRAESRYFFNQQKKCIIEGLFKIEAFHLKTFFEENDLDYEVETVLRREISADGKSRAFINDTPVNLTILKTLGEKLIDIHSQHATLEINNPLFQLMVVDAAAGHQPLLDNHRTKFSQYKKDNNRLKKLIEESNKAKADLDYYQFQFDELEKATLIEDEQEKLEKELYTLNNAEEIKRNLLNAGFLLQDSETAVLLQLREAMNQLVSAAKFNADIELLRERLNSTVIELKDVVAEIENIEQRTFTDEARADEINNRLTIIYNLQKKHRVSSNSELLALQADLSDKIQHAVFGDEAIEKLQKQLVEQRKELEGLAAKLSAGRTKAIPEIEKQVLQNLAEMGMANSALSINLTDTALEKDGANAVRFLFSANKGHALAEMSKVASGGELSRLMLAIKALIAKYTALPTIIFDEIDTGVSGEVANRVGIIMEQLAQNLQVITITHLPQIASKGKAHYYVYKDDSSTATYTRIKQLSNNERVTEIAKMLSGDNPGESALKNAKELLAI
ncbi:DNA repair protein RecN [Mucilaginibacter auburnensis]|uniref:DNA repair protein RecN n=1 Tax=Mucilaginibacter auburnensis TaxID=1457233 RepID=A0A2H9VS78_9SPHI|nr:DNA repair protein RecN [Mucilaginibacter auburnensis]PJJ83649.1 DNA repair protein RecN (Recombination protein N) [Mucilaginibacter auburnensis]